MYSSFLGIGCVLDFFCVYGGILVIFFDLWGHFGHIQVIEGILVFFRHGGYFGYFRCFGVRWSIFKFWGLFLSFSRFRGCISLFLGIWCVLDIFCVYRGILVIFCALWGYFGLIQVIEGILIFFRHFGGGGLLCSFSML